MNILNVKTEKEVIYLYTFFSTSSYIYNLTYFCICKLYRNSCEQTHYCSYKLLKFLKQIIYSD